MPFQDQQCKKGDLKMDFSLYYTPDYLQELAKKIRMPEAAAKAVLEQMSSLDLDTDVYKRQIVYISLSP